eukprot:COSAG02_NODE_1178_length_14042_cov_11.526674_17_plen_95_part_00
MNHSKRDQMIAVHESTPHPPHLLQLSSSNRIDLQQQDAEDRGCRGDLRSESYVLYSLPTEPCVLRTFEHDGKLNTCAQSVPKKFRDRLHTDKNQ